METEALRRAWAVLSLRGDGWTIRTPRGRVSLVPEAARASDGWRLETDSGVRVTPGHVTGGVGPRGLTVRAYDSSGSRELARVYLPSEDVLSIEPWRRRPVTDGPKAWRALAGERAVDIPNDPWGARLFWCIVDGGGLPHAMSALGARRIEDVPEWAEQLQALAAAMHAEAGEMRDYAERESANIGWREDWEAAMARLRTGLLQAQNALGDISAMAGATHPGTGAPWASWSDFAEAFGMPEDIWGDTG